MTKRIIKKTVSTLVAMTAMALALFFVNPIGVCSEEEGDEDYGIIAYSYEEGDEDYGIIAYSYVEGEDLQ